MNAVTLESTNNDIAWTTGYSVGFEEGRKSGFDDGFNAGKKVGLNDGFDKGYDQGKKDSNGLMDILADKIIVSLDVMKNTINCAEEFIKKYNEKFSYPIVSARIGVETDSGMPTSAFVIDYPRDINEDTFNEINKLKRLVERSFSKKYPLCVWSLSKGSLDSESFERDFPIYRKIV